jgi:hypothetical protein
MSIERSLWRMFDREREREREASLSETKAPFLPFALLRSESGRAREQLCIQGERKLEFPEVGAGQGQRQRTRLRADLRRARGVREPQVCGRRQEAPRQCLRGQVIKDDYLSGPRYVYGLVK